MSLEEVVHATSSPYKSLLWDGSIFGRPFITKQLAFNMQRQTQSNWCWAAASTSVSHYYWRFSHWTQCKVCNAELNRTDACNSPVPAACNVPWYLDRALTRTKNYVSITGQITFAQIRAEIDAGRPVGARVGWNGGGGHFMMIYGYATYFGAQYVDIDDPIYGKSHLRLSDFSTNYQGSGTWTHTYFTKSYFKLPWLPVPLPDPVLKKIWESRQMLHLKRSPDPEHAERTPDDDSVQIGLAHHMYSLGLDRLLGDRDEGPDPIGLRVYETTGGTATAFFDVDQDAEANVRQMSTAASHLEPFTRVVEAAIPLAERSDRNTELRLFRVPALNFEALWVSQGGGEQDFLLPLTDVGGLAVGSTYSYEEALRALREAAQPLADMDDTMGA
ncbi:papain-like cysteine protease family protein [Arthrobacter sp. Cr_A7]|uniref:papain-like cysteine protease family protein n=1 Tax=Arthrobacter sp. Cr_A7 TaxID=3031017 RepID=UPI0023DA2CF4|nr:papain-like cysteine protease family protein [Arthrobacter sp. Cr_A7]MDF2050341.1 papain-like cysteine protease family protein [Arthrobacter sp. Cr_A7]